MRLLFVYGSLLSGMGNHRIIEDGEHELLGEFITPSNYTMIDMGAFPAVIAAGVTAIKGEVYSVSEAVWERVERLEGYPSFYHRSKLTTPYGEAEMYVVEAGMYDRRSVVESGDWIQYYQRY